MSKRLLVTTWWEPETETYIATFTNKNGDVLAEGRSYIESVAIHNGENNYQERKKQEASKEGDSCEEPEGGKKEG